MRVDSRGNQYPRRGGKLIVGGALAVTALSGCGDLDPLTEPIPTYAVPTTETVAPTRLPGESGTGPAITPPSPETAQPEVGHFTVCFGAFVDYTQNTLTVNPLMEPANDHKPEQWNPLITDLRLTGGSQIRRRLPYESPNDYEWLNSDGAFVGDSPSDCRDDVPVHFTQIVQAESDQPGPTPAVAAPTVSKNQVIDAWDPGDVEKSGLYHQAFRFENGAQLQDFQRQMRAAS